MGGPDHDPLDTTIGQLRLPSMAPSPAPLGDFLQEVSKVAHNVSSQNKQNKTYNGYNE